MIMMTKMSFLWSLYPLVVVIDDDGGEDAGGEDDGGEDAGSATDAVSPFQTCADCRILPAPNVLH